MHFIIAYSISSSISMALNLSHSKSKRNTCVCVNWIRFGKCTVVIFVYAKWKLVNKVFCTFQAIRLLYCFMRKHTQSKMKIKIRNAHVRIKWVSFHRKSFRYFILFYFFLFASFWFQHQCTTKRKKIAISTQQEINPTVDWFEHSSNVNDKKKHCVVHTALTCAKCIHWRVYSKCNK